MPTPEQNIALKDGLSVFLQDDPGDYTQPLQSPQDAIARGILDETGTATDKGVLFTQLQDEGIFDARGALTDKGKAYALPYKQTLQPSDLWAYKIRTQDGVDKPSADMGQVAGAIKDTLWDAGAGLLRQAKYGAMDLIGMGNEKSHAEEQAAATAIAEGAVKASMEFAAIGQMIPAHAADVLDNVISNGESGDAVLWEARQMRDKVFNDHQTAQLGETLADYHLMSDAVVESAKLKEQLGDERFAEVTKQGGALGSMIDPTMAIPMAQGAAAGVKAGFITRAALKKSAWAARAAELDLKLANAGVRQSEALAAHATADTAAQNARKLATSLLGKFDATGDPLLQNAAQRAESLAAKYEPQAAALRASLDDAARDITTLQEKRAAIPAPTITERASAVMEPGRAVGPVARAVGDLTERTGDALIRLTKGLSDIKAEYGYATAMKMIKPAAQLAGLGFGGVPGLAGATALVHSGPIFAGAGKIMRAAGKEMLKARGQVPFWQRVANYPEMGPAHRMLAHTLDTATAGGVVPDITRRAGAGVLASYPADLLFEYLQDDTSSPGDTFKRALSKSMVLGGSSAALGGMFLGSKERHKQLALGDQRNFIDDLRKQGDAAQIERFNAIPPGVQRSIATYAAANPNLNFHFTVEGNSRFDTPSNTAIINIAGQTPLKALVGHEVNHNLLVRNQMEDGVIASLVGDGEIGGLLRAQDGTLDPEFQSFMDSYNNERSLAGLDAIGVKEAAKEFFVEVASELTGNAAESGKLGQMAGKTNIRRAVESLLPKAPILRDLHMKLGGLMEPDTGRMIVGNGLLSEGLRERPEIKRMWKEMTGVSSGRSQGAFKSVGEKAADRTGGGVEIPVVKGNKAMEEIQGVSLHQMDANGSYLRDAAGNLMPISPGMDMQRANIGLEARRIHDDMVKWGYQFKPGEIRIGEDGKWTSGYLSAGMLRGLRESGIYNAVQMRQLTNISNAIKNDLGARFAMINQPTMKKINGKNVHKPRPMTLNEVAPYLIEITADNNIIIRNIDVKQLRNNIDKLADTKTGKRLYNGDKEKIMRDISQVMEIRRNGGTTDQYFIDQYGAVEAKNAKNFINSMTGLLSKEQRANTPDFQAGGTPVVRSYRADRINQATKLTGETVGKLPFTYDAWKLNLFPNGIPIRK